MTAPKLPSAGGSYTRDESGKLTPVATPKPASAEKTPKAKPAVKKEA